MFHLPQLVCAHYRNFISCDSIVEEVVRLRKKVGKCGGGPPRLPREERRDYVVLPTLQRAPQPKVRGARPG